MIKGKKICYSKPFVLDYKRNINAVDFRGNQKDFVFTDKSNHYIASADDTEYLIESFENVLEIQINGRNLLWHRISQEEITCLEKIIKKDQPINDLPEDLINSLSGKGFEIIIIFHNITGEQDVSSTWETETRFRTFSSGNELHPGGNTVVSEEFDKQNTGISETVKIKVDVFNIKQNNNILSLPFESYDSEFEGDLSIPIINDFFKVLFYEK
jgi:hypothetical protein